MKSPVSLRDWNPNLHDCKSCSLNTITLGFFQQNKALEKVDGYIGDLMDALLAVDMHECASIIILADHGMANRSCEDAAIILGDVSSHLYLKGTKW